MSSHSLLEEERNKGTRAVVDNLRTVLAGGKYQRDVYEKACDIVCRDKTLQDMMKIEQSADASAEERKEQVVQLILYWQQLQKRLALDDNVSEDVIRTVFDIICMWDDGSFSMRYGVHHSLYRTTILTQGTAQQVQHFLPPANHLTMHGCFAMTELGHSSFLQDLETTATYVRETQEFVVNSPTMSSVKVWIGGAGQTSTYAAVMARLLIPRLEQQQQQQQQQQQGPPQFYGLFWFIVPLRHSKSGRVRNGVYLGDMGPKAGRRGIDNGWIRFDHVRIPHFHMLSRWGQVTKDGKFVSCGQKSSISYATLIGERISLIGMMADSLEIGVTIGTRFSVTRTQGPKQSKLIHIPTQYTRLCPAISICFALRLYFQQLKVKWETAQKHFESGEWSEASSRQMSELHANTCAIKAWYGWKGADILETVRRLMGGHSFSMYSRIPQLMTSFAVLTQGGGPGATLALQTGRYMTLILSKIHKFIANGDPQSVSAFADQRKQIPSSFHYLFLIREQHSEPTCFDASLCASTDLYPPIDTMRELLLHLACKCASEALSCVTEASSTSETNEKSTLTSTTSLMHCSRLHSSVELMTAFVSALPNTSDSSAQKILKDLCALFLLYTLSEEIPHLVRFGLLAKDGCNRLLSALSSTCLQIRPWVVPLTDAFNKPDYVHGTPLALSDGDGKDPWEAYFALLQTYSKRRQQHTTNGTPLTDPVGKTSTPYWNKLLASQFRDMPDPQPFLFKSNL